MRDTSKEDVFVALRSFENYISEMSDEDFKMFIIGRPIFGAMLPPRWQLCCSETPEDYRRSITRLEFRIS